MSVPASALLETPGYLVADSRGQIVGRVECPMYGTGPDLPDALSVRKSGLLFTHKRHLVPAESIEEIDESTGVVELRVERNALRSFL
jgi:hypothetical protein